MFINIANWILSMDTWGFVEWAKFIGGCFVLVASVWKLVKALSGGGKTITTGNVSADRKSIIKIG